MFELPMAISRIWVRAWCQWTLTGVMFVASVMELEDN